MVRDNRLTFSTLTEVNKARLPHFKNRAGEFAHSTMDGSCWTPSQWLEAVFGELGELFQVRLDFEDGKIGVEELERCATQENADTVIYAEIESRRILDITDNTGEPEDASKVLVRIVATLGMYANKHKKCVRGDITEEEFEKERTEAVGQTMVLLKQLLVAPIFPTQQVTGPHPTGIDLGQAVTDTFNDVSRRVSSSVVIEDNGDGWFLADH